MCKLYDCVIAELAEIYDAEKQLAKALPKMAEAAQHEQLKTAFGSDREKTENHARRLEQVFAILGEKTPSRKCKAMQSLIHECEEGIDDDLGDAALICAAQKIEHYEIATYGCLRSWSQFLDQDEAANLLEETLDDENATDEHLTSLAVQIINLDAGEDAEEDNSEDEWTTEHAAKRNGSLDN